MKRHTKIYLDYFGLDKSCWIMCEIPGCGKCANAIHHIDRRGMGGDPKGKKDVIENLMAVCDSCHTKYGDKKQYKDWLIQIHYSHINKIQHENNQRAKESNHYSIPGQIV